VKQKKTILHIIQNFGRGGAETAVVGVLKNLSEYNNIVVTLDSLNEFGDELKYDKYYSLDLKSYYLFPFAIKKLKRIIKENDVDLVHSQLYWSTILARFACPRHIPLVTSIQASLSESVEYKKKWIGWLDKFSYNRRDSVILGVSQHTLDDYFDFLKLKRRSNYVLYNFVDTSVFLAAKQQVENSGDTFRLVSVGNLKEQKNHRFLLEAFLKLKNENISLDIYGGGGQLKIDYEKFIQDHQLPVRLMGKVTNLNKLLSGYQLFVMSSVYEGFSLAVLEGMVMEKPMLLSDIPTFREQCADTAIYFSLNSIDDFVNKLKQLRDNKEQLKQLAISGNKRALQNFTLDHHLAVLRKIYSEVLSKA
jgi:L-malate glycosyltransferase